MRRALETASSECAHVFVVDSLKLFTASAWTTAAAFEAVRRIVDIGIPNEQVQFRIRREDQLEARLTPEWRESCILFVKAICGHGESRRGVRKINVPLEEATHPDFEMFCLALLHSRGVRTLTLATPADSRNAFTAEPFPGGIWTLIALTLTNRVPRKVLIISGTEISSYYGIDGVDYTCASTEPIEALDYEANAGTTHVLIVGRGFCQVPTSALPSKRMRSTRRRRSLDRYTSSLLKAITISTSNLDTWTQPQLRDFLEFAGGPRLQNLWSPM